jgi:hypothetical protein
MVCLRSLLQNLFHCINACFSLQHPYSSNFEDELSYFPPATSQNQVTHTIMNSLDRFSLSNTGVQVAKRKFKSVDGHKLADTDKNRRPSLFQEKSSKVLAPNLYEIFDMHTNSAQEDYLSVQKNAHDMVNVRDN